MKPHIIVLSGDLAMDFGEIEAYIWIKEQMDACGIPYLVMSGNHDSVERLNRIFHLEDRMYKGMLCYKELIGGKYPVFFLDSEPDLVSEEQLVWLLEESRKLLGEALLFMHHPPTLCGHLFMDRKYPLRNITQVQHYLYDIPNIKHIMVGHYHFAKSIPVSEGKTVLVCPSTQMQISESNSDFEISNANPGWRMLEWDGKHLKTEVYMLSLYS